jgi:hypothetical protein
MLQLWESKTVLRMIVDIQPQLASWDKSTHPSQIRLQVYRQPRRVPIFGFPCE